MYEENMGNKIRGEYKMSVTPWMEISNSINFSSCSKSLPQQDNSDQGMLHGSYLGLLV